MALFGWECQQIDLKGNISSAFRQKIIKGDSTVPVTIFMNDSYKEISVIIFSDKTVEQSRQTIGEDCIFINNPFAKNPVDSLMVSFLNRWCAHLEKDKIVLNYIKP
ncbi:MAG: hypothetical protein HQK91_07245 [Nitrospirae bacterium]|nr:hypothetical protein [Nitrospirota bacterium]MBF0541230.1 hypothetical protein [Nitrospirota bacterium]